LEAQPPDHVSLHLTAQRVTIDEVQEVDQGSLIVGSLGSTGILYMYVLGGFIPRERQLDQLGGGMSE
jgi:hypothetical protein